MVEAAQKELEDVPALARTKSDPGASNAVVPDSDRAANYGGGGALEEPMPMPSKGPPPLPPRS